jgi:hypothetical protein
MPVDACRIAKTSSTQSRFSILATGGCGFTSVTLPAWVLALMAAIASVRTAAARQHQDRPGLSGNDRYRQRAQSHPLQCVL